ncbi:response regulator [Massilia sp. G4R7]|uniref:histidine kinase n=1 Tax=Massilia phyllostachyos TaxID=2898585 RepID=A0ABS8Q337_9BURK|nr:ATP-binding protein [Massilia phyllostachyos]MCD2516163.1 response regulator [Massilia phyllostachyos]
MTDPRKAGWDVVAAVCAPFGQDGQALAEQLEAWGARARPCGDGETLAAAVRDAALTVLLVTDDALEAHAAPLAEGLREQPSWSDLPIIVFSAQANSGGSLEQWAFLRQFANLTVLARPSPANVLRAAFDAACRARAWQFTVREQMQTLSAAAALLEQRVLERTAELYAEVETRKRVESALNESRKLEAIGRLTGGVAHDFNNLLQVIQGSTTLLPLVEPGGERFQRALHAIQRAASRGAKLTHQLLAFGRRQALAGGVLDLARQLEEMRDLLQQSLREQIPLTLDIEAGLWLADADLTQLEVALLNLAVNAKDAMPRGGAVTIGACNLTLPSPKVPDTELRGEFVWLTVADTGPGMAPEVAAQAFDPFFTTKPVGAGTGLGLSQVYGFARQSGGTAWIDSSPDGTTVSILLPRSRASEAQGKVEAGEPAGMVTVAGARVLLVEDDPEVADATLTLLDNLGCKATLARDAQEALRQPLDRFDLLFSDVVMPGALDGIGLARQVRELRPAMPILLASGYVVAPERLQGLSISVLAKPYTQEELRKALGRLL